MSNPKICCWEKIGKCYSVILVSRCSPHHPNCFLPRRWQAPSPTWLLSNYEGNPALPVISTPWVSSSTNGFAENAHLKDLPGNCSINICRSCHPPYERKIPHCLKRSKTWCSRPWRRTQN